MNKERLYILESMPVPKAIVHLALPTVLSMIVQILYNLTDTFFIGKLNDPYQVAAVTISLPLFMVQMAMAGVFGNGGASYLSRLLGMKDFQTARETTTFALFSCFATSIVTAIVGALLIPQILHLTGSSIHTEGFAYRYMLIILLGSPIVMLNFTLTQLLRAEGAARSAMTGLIIGTVVNIILDPLFIFVFKMGVTGAALATVTGNGFGVLYYASYYLRGHSMAAPSWKILKYRAEIFKEILKIGIPSSLSSIMMSIGSTLSYKLASAYSDHHVAALGVAMRVFQIPIFIFLGVAIGTQPLIGYSYGAGLYSRMKQTIRTALLISLSMSAVFTAFFALFPRFLMIIFIRDETVVSIGIRILEAYVFAIPFAAMGMIFMVSIQSIGKAIPALIVALSRQGIVYIPAILLLNHYYGFFGLNLALPLADALTVCISFSFLYFILKDVHKHPGSRPVESFVETLE